MSQAGPSKTRKGLSTRRQSDFSVLSRDNHDSPGVSYTRIPSISTNPTLPNSTSNPLSDLVEFGGFIDDDDNSETITTSKYRTRSSISSLSGFQYSLERSHHANSPHVLPVSNHPHHPHHSHKHQPQLSQFQQFQRPHQSIKTEWNPLPTSKSPVFDVESDFERAASDSCDEDSASLTSANTEIQRLRQELASMKKTHEQYIGSANLKAKKMKDLATSLEAEEARSAALSTELKTVNSATDKIREHLQCQICLEILNRPWTLSPCGHVACLVCLASWFLTPTADEDPTFPSHPRERTKTCPQCRTIIRAKPTPSFILKNIIEDMQRAGILPPHPSSTATESLSILTADDPWQIMFSNTCSCGLDSDDEDDEDDEDDHDNDHYRYHDNDDLDDDELSDPNHSDGLSIDSPSESSEYHVRQGFLQELMGWELEMRDEHDHAQGEWVPPRWESPRFESNAVDISEQEIAALNRPRTMIAALIRRGATKQMIADFKLTYDHESGIVVNSNDANIHLGWNISRNANDLDGGIFMTAVMDEVKDHPYRFAVHNHESLPRGKPCIVRLVPKMETLDDLEGSDASWTTEESLGRAR